MAARSTGTAGPFAPLRVPAFARLFAAGTASAAGTGIGNVALIWLVFRATGSAVDVALVGVASLIGSLGLSLVAGALVDRTDRRRLLILADGARAAGLAVLVVVLLAVGFALPVVLGASFVLGAFTTLFAPAERTLVPAVVGEDHLADANGLVMTSNGAVGFVASAVGGVLIVAAGAVVALGINVATFAVSAALIAGIVLPRAVTFPRSIARAGAPDRSLSADLAEGVRYLGARRGLLFVTLSSGLENFFFAMATPFLVVYATVVLHAGAVVFGAIVGLLGLGWGPGSLLVGPSGAVRRAGLVWSVCGVAEGALVVAFVLFPSVPVALAIALSIGILLGYSNTTWLTTVQLEVPSEMQGRFFGLDQLASWAIIPVGNLVGGLAITAIGVPVTFALAGGGTAAGAAAFLLSGSVRSWGHRPAPEAPVGGSGEPPAHA